MRISGALGGLAARLADRRAAAGGMVALVALPLLVVMARADGIPSTRVEMSGGGAWLASPAQGVVTLIDGPSEQVVALQPGGRAGDELATVQAGAGAYLVNRTDGTVARVDGATYQPSEAYEFGDGRGGALDVYPGKSTTYVVDGRRRLASLIDPQTLRVRERLSLAAQPGPGQSVVDGSSRLWLVDAGGLSWFDGDSKHVRPGTGNAKTRLVPIGGRPHLVDLDRSQVSAIRDDGSLDSWSCLDIPAGEDVQLLGSTALGRVLAAVPSTGGLVISGRGGEDCGRVVEVGSPGHRFGPLVESGGFAFVPNRTSGRTMVVDLTARKVVADPPVVKPGNRLELIAKDGLVFYNDLDGDTAGVLRFDGQRWQKGKAIRKYRLAADGRPVTDRRPGPAPAAAPKPTTVPPAPTGTPSPQPTGSPPPPAPTDGPPVPRPSDDPPPPRPTPGTSGPTGQPPPRPTGTTSPAPSPSPSPSPSASPTPTTEPVALTVTVTGPGTVSAIVDGGSGPSCAPTCTITGAPGTSVQLTAAPTADGELTDWGVTGCAPARTCDLVLEQDRTATVTFTPLLVLTVILDGSGTGTVSGTGLSCSGTTCTGRYAAGTTVTLSGTPSGSARFQGWSGGCSGVGQCVLTLTTSITVTAVFDSVPVLSSGTGVLRGTYLFDFDSGVETQADSDVWWRQRTSVVRELAPENGARLANLGVVDFDSITPAQLAAAPYSAESIVGNDDSSNRLVSGTVVAVRTSRGNTAKVLVVQYGYNLTLRWITYGS